MSLPRHDGTGTGLEALIGSIYTTTLVSTAKKKQSCCFWSISYTWTMVVLLECFQWSCTPTYLHLLEFKHTYKLCTWSSRYRALDTIPPIPDVTFHPKLQLVQTRRKLVTPNHPKSIIDLLGENHFEANVYGSVPSNFDSICRYLKIGKPSHSEAQPVAGKTPHGVPASRWGTFQNPLKTQKGLWMLITRCLSWNGLMTVSDFLSVGSLKIRKQAYPMFGWTKYEIERKVSVPTNAVQKLLYHFNVYVSVNIYIIYIIYYSPKKLKSIHS